MSDMRRVEAKNFVKRWEGRGEERQDTQNFWIDLLTNVLGVENATSKIDFEVRVKLAN